MDRREFLKKSAIGIASVAAVSVLGKTVYDMMEENEEQTEEKPNTMKKIVILNGSPRKNGYTAALIQAFTEGAQSAGNEVREHYIHGMDVKTCIGCDSCMRTHQGCVQKNDGMQKIYEDLTWCDVVVFACPLYWGTFTAQLKTAVDRMFAWFNLESLPSTKRDCVLLMTARGNDYSMALDQYGVYLKYLGWNDLGTVLGRGLTDEARALGASIR